MPLLESFLVDHTRMPAPAVRLAKKMQSPSGDAVTVYDLRFCRPNIDILSPEGIHTLEHLFAGFMRKHLNGENVAIVDISPMGCRTGFYMSTIGRPDEKSIAAAWEASMRDILEVPEGSIPELNKYQCGSFKMHSLQDAKDISRTVLKQKIGVMSNEELKLDETFLK